MNVLRCFSRVSAVADTLQLRLLIDVFKNLRPVTSASSSASCDIRVEGRRYLKTRPVSLTLDG